MSDQITEVSVSDVYEDPGFNSRKSIQLVDVIQLADSLKTQGLLQPILVRTADGKPPYKIVAGHRRFASVKYLKWEKVNVVIRVGMSDEDALTVNLLENIARKDLNIIEEARAIERYFAWGWSQKRVSEKLSKSGAWVNIRYQLLRLPKEIQDAAEAGHLNQTQIRDISNLTYDEDKFEAVKRIIDYRTKGEAPIVVKPKSKPSIFAKGKPRELKEIGEMQKHIQGVLGNDDFGARALAWAAGIISDHELHESLAEVAASQDITYEMPSEFDED